MKKQPCPNHTVQLSGRPNYTVQLSGSQVSLFLLSTKLSSIITRMGRIIFLTGIMIYQYLLFLQLPQDIAMNCSKCPLANKSSK